MKKNVFIFGAGASKDEGLPIQEELLYSYFQNQQSDQFRPIIAKYFKDFFKLNINEVKKDHIPTFEEALGIIEAAIDNEQSFGPTYSQRYLRQLRTALIMAMGIAIEHCSCNANNTHERLMQALFSDSTFQQDEYGFISFNYDLLLDKSLMKILENDIYVDYGITFANETIFHPPFEHWETPGERCIRFLKPHGSFNWMHCPTCNSMYITGVKESRIFSTGYLHTVEHCLKDKTELSYVMHPPSLYFKTHRNIYVQLVWKHTYDLLAEADKVYFIGYALKDADVWMKYILKKSQVQKPKDFIVVNPQPASQLHETFERLLGEVNYLNQDFSTFVDSLNDYL
ncbi:MAG: hypothetical protein KGY65_03915 [Candidatus Thermoplasmatota archaeon]|nr:hypothetical protein [Candidatus Thermoplasmatota archaeon]MBS3801877.1 hypothetical protein [Candidatus Thermoplasmatota archaeon]